MRSFWGRGHEITKNGVSVDTHLTEEALLVEGDRIQLQQVVLNLIVNAVEAMGSVQEGPRELSIITEQTQADGVLVAVRDSGPGIDAKHLERVFAPVSPAWASLVRAIARGVYRQ
jgi:C4-dicarboxylate-specific signal transduction histidine kinase